MTYDNEMIVPGLSYQNSVLGDWRCLILQQRWKCWNASDPTNITYEWRDVPTVDE